MSHQNAIVIRSSAISLEEAHRVVGDRLCEDNIADYYDEQGRNRQLWDTGSVSVELGTFIEHFFIEDKVEHVGRCFTFAIVKGKDSDIDLVEFVSPCGFWQYSGTKDPIMDTRLNNLLDAQAEAFIYFFEMKIKELRAEGKRFFVSMLDYHN